MSKIALTDEQQSAVDRRSSSVLVSAAAGSGKTRVLTERLMSYVTDPVNPVDIDSFLVITYTRAAAAELRSRILEELSALSSAEPENRRLRRQNTLCYNAKIGTIHSFCTGILRENCHKLSLSPDFRVGDEDSCAILKNRALEKTLDAAYESMDSTPGFALLVDSVGAGQDDSRLAETVLELHAKMQSHPYPAKWAKEQADRLSCDHTEDIGDTDWGRELMSDAKQSVEYWTDRLNRVWQSICENEEDNAPLILAYGDSISETLSQMRSLSMALDIGWDKARSQLPIAFPRLGTLRNFPFEETKEKLKSAREGCKRAMLSINTVFSASSGELIRQIALTAPAMSALLDLTLDFDARYSAEKRRQNLLDFSDLEHFAVELLCDRETGSPTETALETASRYTEIMVDEYQDVSAVQDLIFRCISREEKNIFMVGDVKQSIYRFRLADPSIFLEKYHSFAELSEATEGCVARILLRRNFRSDAAVLDACNHVFSEIMSEKLGDIDYDEAAALRLPEDAPPKRGEVKMTVLQIPQAVDGEERPDKTAAEAKSVAESIARLVQSGETITDNGKERPISYGDIAILLHSPKSVGAIYSRVLAEHGIPVASDKGGGFFDSPEIIVMTAYLSVVDNPHRDVPLAAALSSPVFGFTADELAQIRAADRSCDFFTALKLRAENDEKCRSFIEILDECRALSLDVSVRELIDNIYDRLEIPALWTAVKGSQDGVKNLMLLSDLASQFEDSGYRGLHSFLSHLKSMESRGMEPQSSAPAAYTSVSIMSIHKSKGLEFPVVFLADTARKFNLQELSRPVLIHPELGVGGKVTDAARGIEYPTAAHRAIKTRLLRETVSEEMRVLYVAMTRAKQRLYISCTSADPDAMIQKLSEGLSSPIAPEILKTSPNYASWLVMSAITDGGRTICLETAAADIADAGKNPKPGMVRRIPEESEDLKKLRASLGFTYPFSSAAKLPSKLTATALPDEEKDDEALELAPRRERIFRLPDLSGGDRPLTAAERGTATHIVMQFIDFDAAATEDGIRAEVERIAALGQLTPAQAKAVDVKAIKRFFASDVGWRIKAADSVLREFRFSILCPAEKFFDGAGEEKLLLQGVVDCCIEEKGALTIIDYKTDYVTAETLGAVAEHYKKQLDAYAFAMERISGKPVAGCVLCFLRSGLNVEF